MLIRSEDIVERAAYMAEMDFSGEHTAPSFTTGRMSHEWDTEHYRPRDGHHNLAHGRRARARSWTGKLSLRELLDAVSTRILTNNRCERPTTCRLRRRSGRLNESD
jgi:hypothetical protein